jgi:hypothetical protein
MRGRRDKSPMLEKFSNFYRCSSIKEVMLAGCQWLTPVILATWEAEIWRIVV